MLKNSFRGISRTKFARKLLNLRLPQALKFTQITALVPFFNSVGPGPLAGAKLERNVSFINCCYYLRLRLSSLEATPGSANYRCGT